ncbi:MAG: hypothetical protein IJ113_09540 [Eggerthellaceae bacterium]|nr:hypothetical protein [Eggerthellaceae bacterium]
MTRLLPSSYATGNQIPTSQYIPKYKGNDCLDAIDLLSESGLELMDWQALLLEAWMGFGADGRWTAKNCGNETPRQNGKTRVIQGRAAAEMLFYGGTVIYTSQLQKTSTETFNEVSKLFDSKALRRYLAPNGIKTALGREEVRLKSGASIKFLARTRNGGDGQHGSLLIFDEAQCLDPQSRESFLYAISACQTKRGPQVIYNGTPPKEGDYALLFEKIRNDALEGRSKKTAWTEWSAGYGGRVPNVNDRELWERTNPAYGILISPDTVEAEVESDEAEKFAHQRLGWWTGEKAAQTLIPEAEWRQLEAESPEVYDKLAYGVRISPDGALVTLSVAVKADQQAHIEFIRQEPLSGGLAWLVEWLVERVGKCACVVIDGKSAADDLCRQLIDSGYSKKAVVLAGTEGAINAAAMLVNSVADGKITHYPDENLDDSALKSVRRKIGTMGGFGFGGEHPEIIESAALALYGVKTTKRNPKRRAVCR